MNRLCMALLRQPYPFLTVLDPEADYFCVHDEVTSVAQWFTLGLNLKLPFAKLEMIAADYRFSEEARSKMLHVWLQTGNATWSSLFGALSKMGMRNLGKNIANRRGW